MADRPWKWLLGAGIGVAWLWFAFLGIWWDVLASLFIVIALTILLGTSYAILDVPKSKD